MEREDFKNADETLQSLNGNEELLWALRSLNSVKRMVCIREMFPEIKRWSNLERNYFLWRVDKIIDLGICKHFKIIGEERRQYCCPKFNQNKFLDLVLKMKKGDLNYSLEPLECTCDLLEVYGKCRKELALGRI